MKVWVVMGNDYPESVFASEAAAKEYVEQKKAAPDYLGKYGDPRIYWNVYEFPLIA